MSETEWMGVDLTKIPRGELEFYPFPGQYFGDVMKENGLEVMFGVTAGDIAIIYDYLSELGVKQVIFHDERAAGMAADAYGRIKHKPSILFVDTGPGCTNAHSAIKQMSLSLSPCIVVSGGTIGTHERLYTWQPSNLQEQYSYCMKSVQHIAYPQAIKRVANDAWRDSMAYPGGVVGIEFPLWSLAGDIERSWPITPSFWQPHNAYVEGWRGEQTGQRYPGAAGDPETMERVVKKIMSAKKPLMMGGDGVNFAEAEKEFVEFAELAGLPACGRRSGRGCIPEVHPQNVRLEPYTPDADLLVLIGTKISIFDGGFGMGWPSAIQINETSQHIWPFLKSEEVVIGNPKVVLRQMIDIIKRDKLQPNPEARQWLQHVQERERRGWGRLMERAEKYKNNKPIHHAWLARVAYEVIEDLYGGMNRYFLDGMSMGSFAPAYYKARYPMAVMDAAEHAGIGHSIGQCIGAFFADPEKAKVPGVMWLGDAGFGIGAFDFETMCRYDIPGVAIVNNNGGWMPAQEYLNYGKGWSAFGPQDRAYGQNFLPGIRYENIDKVFPWVKGFYVEDPDQIRPTLEKAFRAAEKGGAHGKGGPAVVHVPVEPSILQGGEINFYGLLLWGHLPFAKISKHFKRARRYYLGQPGPANMPWFDFAKWGFPELSPEDMPDPWDPISDDMATP